MNRIAFAMVLLVAATGCSKSSSGGSTACAKWEACCIAASKTPSMAHIAKACPQESAGGSWAVYRALPLGSDQVCKDGLATMVQSMQHMPGGPPAVCAGGNLREEPCERGAPREIDRTWGFSRNVYGSQHSQH